MSTSSCIGMANAFSEELLIQVESEMSEVLWLHMASTAIVSFRVHGGSLRGKAPNVHWHFQETHGRYMLRYFWSSEKFRPVTSETVPSQSERTFQRRFRMPRYAFFEGDGRMCWRRWGGLRIFSTWFTEGKNW